ncbi:MAG TPA: hypothetical protein VE666_08370 [Mycobacterium sp.]|jgi:hypothetical protein|nr:hypothetical protein [Mycobacterium sp.]
MTAPLPVPAGPTGQSDDDFGLDRPGLLGPGDLQSLSTVEERLFETEEDTPCRVNTAGDLWFSPFRDRERAARQCLQCPFLGRSGSDRCRCGRTGARMGRGRRAGTPAAVGSAQAAERGRAAAAFPSERWAGLVQRRVVAPMVAAPHMDRSGRAPAVAAWRRAVPHRRRDWVRAAVPARWADS